MYYGILDSDRRFVLIDADKERFYNTLPFLPQYGGMPVTEHAEDDVEKAYTGEFYLRGYAPQRPLGEAREEKRALLKTAFDSALADAHCMSSAGFEIDADDTAVRNVDGRLLTTSASDTIDFCDYANEFHTISRDELEVIRHEIAGYRQWLYDKKWDYRKQINAAQTVKELDAIAITFGAGEPEGQDGSPEEPENGCGEGSGETP